MIQILILLSLIATEVVAHELAPGGSIQITCTPCPACSLPSPTPPGENGLEEIDSFDLTTVNSDAKGFAGTVTDGQYVYYAPNYMGARTVVARYNSHLAFDNASAWSFFNIHALGLGGRGYAGAEFDGRYIYFAPHNTSVGGYHSQALRYDTQADFTNPSSWSAFNIGTKHVAARGFIGTGFDGQNVYFIPYGGGVNPYIAKYDTTQPFTDAASWEIYGTTHVNFAARGFIDSAFDGRYLYLAPYHNGSNYHGRTLRYDTTLPMGTSSSWEVLDLVQYVNSAAAGYDGAVFNNGYIYFVPYTWGGVYHAHMVRFDTTKPFTLGSSWEYFDASSLCSGCRGYIGAGTDGRYIYYSPKRNNSAFHGNMLKYDTTQPFTNSVAWEVVKLDENNSALRDYDGDITKLGNWMYLSPNGHPSTGYGVWHGNATRFKVD